MDPLQPTSLAPGAASDGASPTDLVWVIGSLAVLGLTCIGLVVAYLTPIFDNDKIPTFRFACGCLTVASTIPAALIFLCRGAKRWLLPFTLFIFGVGFFYPLEAMLGDAVYGPQISRVILHKSVLAIGLAQLFATLLFIAPGVERLFLPRRGQVGVLRFVESLLDRALPIPWWLPVATWAPEQLRRLVAADFDLYQVFLARFFEGRFATGAWGRGNLGDSSALLLPLEFLGQTTIIFAALVLLDLPRQKTVKDKVLCASAALPLLLNLMDLVASGNRNLMIAPLAVLTALMLLRETKISPKMWLASTASMGLGVLAIFFQSETRGYGIMDFASSKLELASSPIIAQAWADKKGLEILRYFVYMVDYVQDQPLQWGYTLGYWFLHPIPRFLWPEKPLPFTHEFNRSLDIDPTGEVVVRSVQQGTFSPGLFGEWLPDYSWAGLPMAVLAMFALSALISRLLPGQNGSYARLSIWAFQAAIMYTAVRGIFALVVSVYPTLIFIGVMMAIGAARLRSTSAVPSAGAEAAPMAGLRALQDREGA
jgi:hypothetical protein